MKNILFSLAIFVALSTEAQTIFFKTYGSTNKEEGKSLALCSDGGFVIGADVTLVPPAPDSSYILIIRTDSNGDTLWTRIINSGENDFCVKVIQTSDLGFAVLSNKINSNNNSKIMLIKLDAFGAIQWNKTFLDPVNGLTGYSFIEKMQGGYAICGGKTFAEGLLINTNQLGDTIWTKIYGHITAMDVPFQDIRQLSDSTFVILSANYNINIFYPRMLRIDGSGNIMYANEYIDASLDDGISVSFARMIESNQYAFAGSSRTNQYNRFIIKVDSLFNIQWQQKYSVSAVNIISDIVQMPDSGLVFIAAPYNSAPNHYCLMVKTNSSGVVLWSKEFQYVSLQEFQYSLSHSSRHALISTPDNGIAFCGFFMDTISSNNKDLALIKVDANGNIPCDGITTNVVDSAITFLSGSLTCTITWGTFLTSSTLTAQGGIPTNNLCFATEITERGNENEMGCYPNPVEDNLNIEISSRLLDKKYLKIYDVLGAVALQACFTSKKYFADVSTLSPGIYIVEIKTGEDIARRKIVKQ